MIGEAALVIREITCTSGSARAEWLLWQLLGTAQSHQERHCIDLSIDAGYSEYLPLQCAKLSKAVFTLMKSYTLSFHYLCYA